MSCIDKSERFLWRDHYNNPFIHLQAAPWVNPTFMLVFRLLAIPLIAFPVIDSMVHAGWTHFIYLTSYGEDLCLLYFILVSIHTLRMKFSSSYSELITSEQQSTNPFRFWKWIIIVYEICFTFEWVIVPFFWTILFPGLIPIWDEITSESKRTYLTAHSIAFVCINTELILNRLPMCYRHWMIVLAVAFAYGLFNLGYVKVVGYPIYPPLAFDSLATWGIFFAMPFWFMAIFFFFTFISKLKIRKYKKHVEVGPETMNHKLD
jgi:hypothetical protein